MAVGVTQLLPVDDRHTYSREYLEARVAVAMGGRIAEEIFLGTRTTGAGNDLEVATEMARKMVCEWGMSENMGPLTFGKKEEQIFLGKELAQHKDYSEATAILIDREIKRIITECYERARQIVLENKEPLQRIAEALLEREVLEADEVARLVRGEPLEPFTSERPAAAEAVTEQPARAAEKRRRPAKEPPLTPDALKTPGQA